MILYHICSNRDKLETGSCMANLYMIISDHMLKCFPRNLIFRNLIYKLFNTLIYEHYFCMCICIYITRDYILETKIFNY